MGEIGYRKPGQRSIRTKILPNLNGIMEVDHRNFARLAGARRKNELLLEVPRATD